MATPAFEDIAETFDFLDDWEDRYRHLIEMGKALPPMDSAVQVPATKVDGCASQVWILPRIEGRSFDFQGDSDAVIVRGLGVHGLDLVHRQPGIQRMQHRDQAALARLGLDEHLSAQRSNGVRAMIARIRQLAADAG